MTEPRTDYLQAFDAAPDAEKYPLVQNWIKNEPLPFFNQLRDQRPVLVTPQCTLVARFADVRDMLQMPKIFTVDLYKPKMGVTGPEDGYLMAQDDNALHYREKSLMQGLLNRDDLPRIRTLVRETAEQILTESGGAIELVNDYCRMIPVHLVKRYFGLDWVRSEDLIRWSRWNQYDAFNNQPFDMRSDTEHSKIVKLHNDASEELVIYTILLIARKLIRMKIINLIYMVLGPINKLIHRLLGMAVHERPDDMVTRMLRSKFAKQVNFPLTRVGVNAGGLLIGAIETTSQAVAQVVEYFIDNPDLLQTAKEKARSQDTEAFDAMVWEALRFVPIRPDIFRQAAIDYTIAKGTCHETNIKAGEIVRLLTHSAMFDPVAYKNPDAFDPDRNIYHNFVFGFGPHECLGKYIGMEMIPEMVRQIVLLDCLASQGNISYVDPEISDRDGPFPENYEVSWCVNGAPKQIQT
jgi:cytochrome P450